MTRHDRKVAFAEDYGHPLEERTMYWTVLAIEKFEDAYDKDVCEFGQLELQALCDDMLGMRNSSKNVRLVVLKTYLRWCKAHGYGLAYDLLPNVDLDGLSKWRDKMVSGPDDLQAVLDQAFDKEELETQDNVYRCWLWLAFLGVARCDCGLMACYDVDLANDVIRYGEYQLPICKEALECVYNCTLLTSFNVLHSRYMNGIGERRDRVTGDGLLRGTRADYEVTTMVPLVSRSLSKSHRHLTYDNVRLSGTFYRKYIEEVETGTEPDFTDDGVQRIVGSLYYPPYNYTNDADFQRKLRHRIKDFRTDYSLWKKAFGLAQK